MFDGVHGEATAGGIAGGGADAGECVVNLIINMTIKLINYQFDCQINLTN